MIDEIKQIEEAIAALEGQRTVLGDTVVETALAPLRDKLAALRSASTSEQRKLVTVLFADLVGFTALSSGMDPEDVREIMAAYFARWTGVIEEHGGVIEKFIGDAVMSVFGLHMAREDDPENAIRAALEMRRELTDLNREVDGLSGVQLQMRVGITTGLVVVSTLEERKGQDFVVVGDTVNLASRLQSAAPPDGILISHDTYRHVRGIFEVQALAPLALKGVKDSIQTYLVKAAKPRAFRLPTRGVEGVETPMIGRQGELKQLQGAFQHVTEDRVWQFVTLVGEPGIGKSRLMYEFDNWLELLPQGVFYFKGRAFPAMQNTPYALLRNMFAYRFQIQDSDAPHAVREKLERGVEQALGKDELGQREAHFIGRLLGFEFGESEYSKEWGEDARQFHDQALVFLGQYFQALAQVNPVVVLLEDLHWADDSSLDLINRQGTALAKLPILVVGATRPALFERRPHWGEGLPYHVRLNLQPLSRRDTRQLLQTILKKVEVVPAILQDLVVRSAEGNPFFVEELVKMLIESGAIVTGDDGWDVVADRLEAASIPRTLLGVLQARTERLAAEERALLQRASVIGRAFWDKAVEHMGRPPRESSSTKPVSISDLLQNLRQREMIFHREKSTFIDTEEYLFKHALLRDVVYESLLKAQRRNYHRRAAEWLEQVTERSHRSGEYADLIAGHYEQAGELSLAASWYQSAGEQAAARFANTEAVKAFSRAIDLLPDGDQQKRFELLLAREKVYNLQGARDDQLRDLEALRALADEVDQDLYRAQAALVEAQYNFVTGDFPAATASAGEAVALASSAGDVKNEAQGYLLHAATLIRQGAFQPAQEQAEHALRITREHGFKSVEAETLRHLGLVAYFLGNPHSARSYFQQALELFQETGNRQGEATALNNLGGVFQALEDYPVAGPYFQRAVEVFREIGDRTGLSKALNNLAIALLEQGEHQLAEEHYLESLRLCREVGHRSGEGSVLDELGLLALLRHNYEQALAYHEQALQVTREIGDKIPEGFTLINIAMCSAVLGDYSSAFAYAREAQSLFGQLGDPQREAYTLIVQCDLYLDTGDTESAYRLAEQTLDIALKTEISALRADAHARLGHTLVQMGRAGEAVEHFQQALEIRRSLGDQRVIFSVMTGLAEALWITGSLEQAVLLASEVLERLDNAGTEGLEKPFDMYLSCYHVLAGCGDPRAGRVLSDGYHLLLACAGKIADETRRGAFLENPPGSRGLMQAWKEHGSLETSAEPSSR